MRVIISLKIVKLDYAIKKSYETLNNTAAAMLVPNTIELYVSNISEFSKSKRCAPPFSVSGSGGVIFMR